MNDIFKTIHDSHIRSTEFKYYWQVLSVDIWGNDFFIGKYRLKAIMSKGASESTQLMLKKF